jgi:hypothetical protein
MVMVTVIVIVMVMVLVVGTVMVVVRVEEGFMLALHSPSKPPSNLVMMVMVMVVQ